MGTPIRNTQQTILDQVYGLSDVTLMSFSDMASLGPWLNQFENDEQIVAMHLVLNELDVREMAHEAGRTGRIRRGESDDELDRTAIFFINESERVRETCRPLLETMLDMQALS